MDSLIQSQILFDSLDTNERRVYVNKVIERCAPDIINEALFMYFSKKILSFQPYDSNHINLMNESLTDIIYSRDTIEESASSYSKLDEISPPLISKIASFLNEMDYIHFSQTNRKIYIGCHSPYSLTSIDFINNNYPRLSPQKLVCLASLKTTAKYFNNNILPYLTTSHSANVTNLEIEGLRPESLIKFMQQRFMNLANLSHLTLTDFYGREPAMFNEFISGCSNLQSIHFKGKFSLNEDQYKMIPELPNLIELEIDSEITDSSWVRTGGPTYLNSFLKKNSKYLHLLAIWSFHISDFDTISFGFDNLKTLRVGNNVWNHSSNRLDANSYNQFLNNTNQLEKVNLGEIPNNSLMVDLIKPLLAKERHLNLLA